MSSMPSMPTFMVRMTLWLIAMLPAPPGGCYSTSAVTWLSLAYRPDPADGGVLCFQPPAEKELTDMAEDIMTMAIAHRWDAGYIRCNADGIYFVTPPVLRSLPCVCHPRNTSRARRRSSTTSAMRSSARKGYRYQRTDTAFPLQTWIAVTMTLSLVQSISTIPAHNVYFRASSALSSS